MPALAKSPFQPAEPIARWAQCTEASTVYDFLTSGFVADPANRWMYPDDEQYLRYFPAFAKAFGGQAFSHGTAILTEAVHDGDKTGHWSVGAMLMRAE